MVKKVVASPNEGVCERVVETLHNSTLRVYRSQDWIGVEVGASPTIWGLTAIIWMISQRMTSPPP